MKNLSQEELERILYHTWCHSVRNDYIFNRLWNDERSVQVALGAGLRNWLDSYYSIRVWFEEERYLNNNKKKRIDICVVQVTEELQSAQVYEGIEPEWFEDLLRCEIKYSSFKRGSIESDLLFLETSEKENPKVKHIFAWIPYTGKEEERRLKKESIIAQTEENKIGFLYGQPIKPFRWSYYQEGIETFHYEGEQ